MTVTRRRHTTWKLNPRTDVHELKRSACHVPD